MKRISLAQVIGVVTLASAMLAGCGGGGDATTVSATAPASGTTTSTPTSDPVVVTTAAVDGIYNGTTSTNQAITALILADNSYYIMYSKMGDPASFNGVAFGSGTLSNGNYFSGSFKDINLTGGVSTGTLVGNYISKQSFIGALGYDNSTEAPTSFSSVYDPSYATAPSLTTVAGVYTGTLAAGPLTAGSPVPSETLVLKITDTGVMSGDLTCSCTLEKATMSLNGNAYAVSLTFSDGNGTHPLHGQAFAGSAYFDAPNKRLVVAGTLLDAAKTPAMFVGTKP